MPTIGASVLARFKGSKKFYSGKVTHVLKGGVCSVVFEDGDFDPKV
jgi:hypothetical protein